MYEITAAGTLWSRLSSSVLTDVHSAAPPHLAAVSRDDPEVSGDPVAALHLHQVTHHHLLCVDALLLAIADHKGLLCSEPQKRKTHVFQNQMASMTHGLKAQRLEKHELMDV